MNTLITKHGLIGLTPFTAPIAALLRLDDELTDVCFKPISPFCSPLKALDCQLH